MSLSRSEHMARVRGGDTAPEKALRSNLWARGYRYRLRYKVPAGRPDLVFPGPKVAVTVDGCFWHGCPEHYSRPNSNSDFWDEKLWANTERDHRLTSKLEQEGWRMLRFWEHEIMRDVDAVVSTIATALSGRQTIQGRQMRVVAVESEEGPDGQAWERRQLKPLRDWNISEYESGPRITGKGKGNVIEDERH